MNNRDLLEKKISIAPEIPSGTTDVVKRCRCGSMPVKETKSVMLGRVEDGGYDIEIGRFHCPVCDDGPSWGQSYSTFLGWDKNIYVWNKWVERKGGENE